MLDISAGPLDQLHIGLDVENAGRDGVVIYVRNNSGGFVNAYARDVFSRRPYLTMTPRGRPSSPARSMLGQRSLERPAVLVLNQNLLSDPEDFTEGYRTLNSARWSAFPSRVGSSTQAGRPDRRFGSPHSLPSGLPHPSPVDIEAGRHFGQRYIRRDTQWNPPSRDSPRRSAVEG
jgi:tricorn protease